MKPFFTKLHTFKLKIMNFNNFNMKNKTHIYFIPKGGFHALKSEYPTLKETLEKYGYKRSQISEWWKQ